MYFLCVVLCIAFYSLVYSWIFVHCLMLRNSAVSELYPTASGITWDCTAAQNVWCRVLQKKAVGSDLYEQVFYSLDLIEKDYFGLQYTDANNVQVSSLHCKDYPLIHVMS
jgi:hypothetical protein